MKIDKRNFPPISILGDEKYILNVPRQMAERNPGLIKKLLTGLTIEGRKNILTSTKEADRLMTKYNQSCVETYLAEKDKKSFGGAYIDMTMPLPSIDLFHFMPKHRMNEETGEMEEVIACLFMSVQGKQNTLVSYGSLIFKNYFDKQFITEPAFDCFTEEEQAQTINYMVYLLELCCFLEYAPAEAKNLITVYGNQRVSIPDTGYIDNRSGLIIKCLCAPQTNKLKY